MISGVINPLTWVVMRSGVMHPLTLVITIVILHSTLLIATYVSFSTKPSNGVVDARRIRVKHTRFRLWLRPSSTH